MSGSGESSSGAAGKALDRDSGAAQPDPPKDKHDAERLRVLMQGYQQGDGAATIELVERLSPMLLRFLAGPLQTRPFAEDMLQDCWLRVHKARHTYRSESPVLPWIFAIARHTRVDAYRRQRNAEGPSRRQGRTGAPSRLVTPAGGLSLCYDCQPGVPHRFFCRLLASISLIILSAGSKQISRCSKTRQK